MSAGTGGRRIRAALLVVTLLVGGCAKAPQSGNSLERISLSVDGKSFVTTTSQKTFTPWGFNYDRDYRMRLLEEYWDAEWETVAADVAEMKALGGNTVRVHLQVARFMDAPDRSNAHALEQLRRLLKLAEEQRVYLDVTGLACYRRADVPDWYASLGERERWEAQAGFWAAVAATCKDSPAVFCYDLVNEPSVPKQKLKARQWLAGDLGPFTYCQFLTLDPAGRSGDEIACAWARRMSDAIRKHDPKRLITIGLLPNTLADSPAGSCGFTVDAVARELDFVAVHFYPETGKLDENAKWLERFDVGKPVVVEEIFPIRCTTKELGQFMARCGPFIDGWVGFYWGRTPAELTATGVIGDAINAEYLRFLQAEKANAVR